MAKPTLPRPSRCRTIPRVCECCQTSFLAIPNEVRRGAARFCSHSCSASFQCRPLEDRFWVKVDKGPHPKGCWLWAAGSKSGGYGAIRDDRHGVQLLAHRLSYELHKGPIPEGLFVCHHCDVPACVNPAHLYAGTKKQNAEDAVKRGQLPIGERCRSAKLTEAAVIAIRRDYAAGATQPELGAKYGINRGYVSLVVTRKRWRHIP